jgi:dihydrofolate synthase/folylpolyglutamate synthase
VVGLSGRRGATGEQLAYDLIRAGVTAPIVTYNDIAQALAAIRSQTVTGDRVLITGSFLTVAGGMKLLEISPFYEI